VRKKVYLSYNCQSLCMWVYFTS